jgi:polyisoprenoid-binding protein YceI
MTNSTLTICVLTLALGAGCAKKDEPAPAPEPVAAPVPTPVPVPEPAPVPAASSNTVTLLATHAEPKPDDPVKVVVSGVELAEVAYTDADNLEGATATIVLDLSTLASGSDKRDAHLKSPDYLAVSEHPKATVKIGDVKRKAGDAYTAKATVEARGMTVEREVEFAVVAKTPEGIRIEGSHKFPRTAFGIGKADGDSVAPELEIQLALALPKPI